MRAGRPRAVRRAARSDGRPPRRSGQPASSSTRGGGTNARRCAHARAQARTRSRRLWIFSGRPSDVRPSETGASGGVVGRGTARRRGLDDPDMEARLSGLRSRGARRNVARPLCRTRSAEEAAREQIRLHALDGRGRSGDVDRVAAGEPGPPGGASGERPGADPAGRGRSSATRARRLGRDSRLTSNGIAARLRERARRSLAVRVRHGRAIDEPVPLARPWADEAAG
jgi:hypothetical protein